MPGRRPLAAVVVLLVGGLLAVGAPARADTVLLWRFEERPAGLPATQEPAQTLSGADASLYAGADGADLTATVELLGVPTEETRSDLHLRIGTVADGGCRTDWELVGPTLDPAGLASRDGTTIRVAVSMDQQKDAETRCGSVSLVGADGVVLDRLEDSQSSTVIADPGAAARVERVRNTSVRPGRWSTVWVRVGLEGADAQGVLVTGAGRGLRVRSYTAEVELHSGDEIWTPLGVRLRGSRARQLQISAQPFGHLAFAFIGTRQVWVRPVR